MGDNDSEINRKNMKDKKKQVRVTSAPWKITLLFFFIVLIFLVLVKHMLAFTTPTFNKLSFTYVFSTKTVLLKKIFASENELDEEEFMEDVEDVKSETCSLGQVWQNHKVKKRFEEKCGYWMNLVENWKGEIGKRKNPKVLRALQERSGTGDRLAGLVGAFNMAISHKRQFLIEWKHLDSVFRPSCFVANQNYNTSNQHVPGGTMWKKSRLVDIDGNSKNVYSGCYNSAYYSCYYTDHEKHQCFAYNRACVEEKYCKDLVKTYPESLTAAHVVGCPLRILMSPSERFLDTDLHYVINGQIVNGTVGELLAELEKYVTIAVHIRSGDNALKVHHSKDAKLNNKQNHLLQETSNCAQRLQNKTQSKTRKDVKWFVASDDVQIKHGFLKQFPDKVISILHRPHHVSNLKSEFGTGTKMDSEVQKLFAEWLVLGSTDELITHRSHNFGISSFSKFARLYHLKTDYHLAEMSYGKTTCRRYEFAYDGNMGRISKSCKRNTQVYVMNKTSVRA